MILVDTNVLSEALVSSPASQVLTWLARQSDLAISAVSVGELRRGILVLPPGRRRDRLLSQVDATLAEHAGRICTYNAIAARLYAHLHASRRGLGRPLAVEDGMIAASGLVHGATAIATRNTKDFEHLGLEIINPWDYTP